MGASASIDKITAIFSKKKSLQKKCLYLFSLINSAIFGLDGVGKSSFAHSLKLFEEKMKVVEGPSIIAVKSKPEDEKLRIFITYK